MTTFITDEEARRTRLSYIKNRYHDYDDHFIAPVVDGMLVLQNDPVMIDYTNYRGVRSVRLISPLALVKGTHSYHKGRDEWYLYGRDLLREDTNAYRMFQINSLNQSDHGSVFPYSGASITSSIDKVHYEFLEWMNRSRRKTTELEHLLLTGYL